MSARVRLRRAARGATLIELAVAMGIVAFLYLLAAPAFSAWIQNTQIRTASESIQNGLQLARAEALRRNRGVMFWLTSAAAPPAADWLVGCATPSGAGAVPEALGDCPGSPTAGGVPANTNVPPINWIQRQDAADQQTTRPRVVATPAGANVVTFNSLGMVIPNLDGSPSLTQIDVSVPAMPAAVARPLRVTVGGGQIRMCDPNLVLANDPRGCQ